MMRVDAAGGDAALAAIDAATTAPGFPPGPHTVSNNGEDIAPLPKAPNGGDADVAGRPKELSPAGAATEKALAAAADAVVKVAAELDEIDKQVGDGDCGSTVALAAEAVAADLKTKYPLNSASGTMAQVALSVKKAVGGTSGALYAVFFSSAAGSLKKSAGDGDATPAQWAAALQAGADGVSFYGGAKGGSRTMLDAILPAAAAAMEAANAGKGAAEVAAAAAAAAHKGADATKGMAPSAGRSSYVPAEVTAKCPDPGAVAVATWMTAIADTLA
uniref:DhaL domain-containing protein n=1 Tax=Chlamydomonas euryale TaxID=1486919 RepID=A0A7R9YZ62_9CHLO